MGGVLIDQNEAVGIFHQDIELVEHADNLELLRRRAWHLRRLGYMAGVGFVAGVNEPGCCSIIGRMPMPSLTTKSEVGFKLGKLTISRNWSNGVLASGSGSH